MEPNKSNILYTITAIFIIMMMGFLVAMASVFWISLYLVIMLIIKIKKIVRNKLPAHQLK